MFVLYNISLIIYLQQKKNTRSSGNYDRRLILHEPDAFNLFSTSPTLAGIFKPLQVSIKLNINTNLEHYQWLPPSSVHLKYSCISADQTHLPEMDYLWSRD